MKHFSIILTFFIFSFSFSQSKKSIKKITKNYDKEKINKIAKEFSKTFHTQKDFALKTAKINGWSIIIKNKNSYSELMRVKDGFPIYYTTFNLDAAISTRANTLHNGGSLGLNIEGQNMVARVWDGGIARITHQEYDGIGGNNRYSIGDGSSELHFHAAHVTGTIMASGVQAQAKGMAPQCSVIGYDWDNDLSEMSTQTNNGMLLSNHSYGAFGSSIPDQLFGSYSSDSRSVDLIMYNAPYYLMVTAAGNDGEENSNNSDPLDGNNQYDKLSLYGCSKNGLVIANAEDASIDENDDLVSMNINSSSSQGPTDDYRIKPDITGNGTQLYSTFDDADNAYQSITGTSMASPNVTGTLLLLQQYYNDINGDFMKAASLKGLALHTADDAGMEGPDAIFGWGLLNAKKATETITNNGEYTVINEISLSAGQSYSTSVSSDGINKLIASISWTDPAGNINNNTNDHTPVLINDLDIRVTQNGNTFYPYKLTSVNSNSTGDNLVDPYERIDIDNASGNYTITVTHKGTLTDGEQNFSLIITGLQYNGICNADDPTNTNATLLFGTASFTWDNVIGATYELRYKPTSSSTWTTVAIENESYEVSGLSGTYNAQVRSICDGNTFSNWVDFESLPSFVLNNQNFIFDDNINIYSYQDHLKIKTLNSNEISNIKIYNILGKLLLKKDYNSNTLIINKDNFSNENLIIIKVALANGSIGYKKVFIN
jgi:hypothetical protein